MPPRARPGVTLPLDLLRAIRRQPIRTQEERRTDRFNANFLRLQQEEQEDLQAAQLDNVLQMQQLTQGIQRIRQANQQQEQVQLQATEGWQRNQMEELVEGFSPDIPNNTFTQTAAFRGADDPIMEGRRLEGLSNLRQFERRTKGMTPEQQATLGPLQVSLAKEGVTSEDFLAGVEEVRGLGQGPRVTGPPASEAEREKQEAFMRVLTTVGGEDMVQQLQSQLRGPGAVPEGAVEDILAGRAGLQRQTRPDEAPPVFGPVQQGPLEQLARGFTPPTPRVGGEPSVLPPDIQLERGAEEAQAFAQQVPPEQFPLLREMRGILEKEELSSLEFLAVRDSIQRTLAGEKFAFLELPSDIRKKYNKVVREFRALQGQEAGPTDLVPSGALPERVALEIAEEVGPERAAELRLGPEEQVPLFGAFFGAEQQYIARHTRGPIGSALNAVGIPNADTIAKFAAEFAVPSTALALLTPGAKAQAVSVRMGQRAMVEGALNVQQDMAGRSERGEEPPHPLESALIFAAGAGLTLGGPAAFGALSRFVGRTLKNADEVLARAGIREAKFVTTAAPVEEALPPTVRGIVSEEAVPGVVPRAAVPEAPVARAAAEVVEGVPRTRPVTEVPDVLRGAPEEEITLFRGLAREGDELLQGAHLTPTRADAQAFADVDARLTGGEPRVVEVRVPRSALEPIDPVESPLAASQGGVRLRDPQQARIIGAAAEEVPIQARPKPQPETPAAAQLTREADETIVKRFAERIRAAKRMRSGAGEKARKAERARRAAAIARIRQQPGLTPQQKIIRSRAAQKGPLPALDRFSALGELGDTDYIRLSGMIDAHHKRLPDFSWVNAQEALEELWLGGNPVPSSRKLLDTVFGKDVARALRSREPLPLKIGEEILALGNVPRMIIAAYDMSMPFRQAVIQTTAHPVMGVRSSKQMLKAALSEDAAKQIERTLSQGPEAAIAREAGLDTPGLFGEFGAAAREEAFQVSERTVIGNLIRKIPGIRMSERGAVTYLNTLRRQLFDQELSRAAKLGISYTDADLKGIASFINATTGRGSIGPLNQYSPALNSIFFSIRLNAGRVQTPFFLFSKSKRVRQMAARDLSRFVTAGLGILGLVKASGIADVEIDPRSSDFGKIKVGPTRIDLWGGFQPLVRYGAQIMSGQRKSALGDIQGISRIRGLDGALVRGIRSKLAPSAGLITDLFAGETFLGEEFSADPADIGEQIRSRLMPLFAQDMFDAFKEQGTLGLVLASPGSVGVTVTSYTSLSEKMQQALAEDFMKGYIRRDYGEDVPDRISDLHPEDQRAFEERHPKLLEELEEMRAKQVEKGDPLATAFEGARQADEQKTEAIRNAAATLTGGQTTRGQFRESVEAAMAADRGQRDLTSFLLEQAGFSADERPEEGPQWLLDRFDYFTIFEKYPEANTNPEQRDALFQEIEDFRGGMGRTREDELDAGLGLDLKNIPLYAELQADKRIIRDSGWYDIWDNAWDQVRNRRPDLPEDPDDYLRTREAELTAEHDAPTASILIGRDPTVKLFEELRSRLRARHRAAHPEVTALLGKWEYQTVPIGELQRVRQATGLAEGEERASLEQLLQQLVDNVNY